MPFSPVPAYVVGALAVAMGLHALLNPVGEYPRFGLPLETVKSSDVGKKDSIRESGKEGVVSPLIYVKANREISFGLGFLILQSQGNDDAITTLAGICSLAGLTDAIVVWRYGGALGEKRAWGHALAFVGLGWWSVWRFQQG